MHTLSFRRVHLDFHTSEHIPDVGAEFDPEEFAAALTGSFVDAVTCFSKCHHGWSYHQTNVGKPHPNLKCDLLPMQIEACHKNNISVPVYLSVGADGLAQREHPEWCVVDPEGMEKSPFEAGWKILCYNTDYLKYVIEQAREVVKNHDVDGLFFDITALLDCCCDNCISGMLGKDMDPENVADRHEFQRSCLKHYFNSINKAVRDIRPGLPVFHNSGHVNPFRVEFQSHLELESLPTGGWGYDHFPHAAKYFVNTPYDFLGMTGKFHSTWGEFGGFKHPNALKYECSAMLACGAKCSIGDQLDPSGKIDRGTYDLVGKAYQEVKQKEPWCENVKSVAQIGLLAVDLDDSGKNCDIGASRILLEGHLLFDVIDENSDFANYDLLILPDEYIVSVNVKEKLDQYLAQNGKLFLTGQSGFDSDGCFVFDAGAEFHGASEYEVAYILPVQPCRPDFICTPMIMYLGSQRIKVRDGKPLGDVYDPYFNRTYKHFCSHQHAPAQRAPSGYDCGVIKGNICYLAHSVFNAYAALGSVAVKDYVLRCIRTFLPETMMSTNLPSVARVSLMEQPAHDRYVLHLLYGPKIKRGGVLPPDRQSVGTTTADIEVIEELLPIYDIDIELRTARKVESVFLQPQAEKIGFQEDGSVLKLRVAELCCHQMLEINFSAGL